MAKKEVAETTTNLPATMNDLMGSSPQEIMDEILQGGAPTFGDLGTIKGPAGGSEFFTVNGEPVKEFEAVILWWTYTKGLYEQDSEPQEGVPPICSSNNGKDGYGSDSREQFDAGESVKRSCKGCPHDEWGTGSNGGKACGSGAMLYVDTGVALPNALKVPTGSLKNLKNHAMAINSAYEARLFTRKTHFSSKAATSKGGIKYFQFILTDRGEVPAEILAGLEGKIRFCKELAERPVGPRDNG